jgi:hypothetical protein
VRTPGMLEAREAETASWRKARVERILIVYTGGREAET